MLRHSPLGKKTGNGASGNGGGSGREGASSRNSWRRSRLAQSDDAGSVVSGDSGADNKTGPSGGSTEAAASGAARDLRPGDIEREVRQQGGVRNDAGGGSQAERSAVVEDSLAVSQARALLMQGLISAEELDAVVRKDQVSKKRRSRNSSAVALCFPAAKHEGCTQSAYVYRL